jgi:hypothetical protein
MRPLHALLLVAALTLGFVACGPSEAERKADSLQVDSTKKEMNNAAAHMIDSMNAAMNAMSGDTAKKDSAKK